MPCGHRAGNTKARLRCSSLKAPRPAPLCHLPRVCKREGSGPQSDVGRRSQIQAGFSCPRPWSPWKNCGSHRCSPNMLGVWELSTDIFGMAQRRKMAASMSSNHTQAQPQKQRPSRSSEALFHRHFWSHEQGWPSLGLLFSQR